MTVVAKVASPNPELRAVVRSLFPRVGFATIKYYADVIIARKNYGLAGSFLAATLQQQPEIILLEIASPNKTLPDDVERIITTHEYFARWIRLNSTSVGSVYGYSRIFLMAVDHPRQFERIPNSPDLPPLYSAARSDTVGKEGGSALAGLDRMGTGLEYLNRLRLWEEVTKAPMPSLNDLPRWLAWSMGIGSQRITTDVPITHYCAPIFSAWGFSRCGHESGSWEEPSLF